MRDKFWLLIVAGETSFMIALAVCGIVLLGMLGSKIALTRREEEIAGVTLMILATGTAAWWMFRKLQSQCTRREARALATAVAALTPVSLGGAILFAETSGGYADLVLGSPFGLVGAVVGVIVVTNLVNFALCLFTLWMTRQIVILESKR